MKIKPIALAICAFVVAILPSCTVNNYYGANRNGAEAALKSRGLPSGFMPRTGNAVPLPSHTTRPTSPVSSSARKGRPCPRCKLLITHPMPSCPRCKMVFPRFKAKSGGRPPMRQTSSSGSCRTGSCSGGSTYTGSTSSGSSSSGSVDWGVTWGGQTKKMGTVRSF